MSLQGALSGITVLDLSRLLPGPFCSMVLADHGARVIAIAPPRQDQEECVLNLLYRNKERMALNLKADEGKKIFFQLCKNADVVLEGFRPGVVGRLGIDCERVQGINPDIVYCSITGYGQTGPLKNRAGHDVNFLSLSGVLDLIGQPDCPPTIPGVQIADLAGALNAAVGILLALYTRTNTGKGQYVDISMTDAMASFLPMALELRRKTGQAPRRGDNLLSHRYACYNVYETADGRYLSVGAMEQRFWKQLCEHLGVPEYAPLQFDEDHRQEILHFMRTTMRKKTLAAWEKDLGHLDLCCTSVRNLEEVLEDPLFRQREMVVEMAGADKKNSATVGTPIKLSKTPGGIRTAPVDFAQNTEAILKELGYSHEAIKVLSQKGVV